MSIVINRGQDALSVEIINAQGKKILFLYREEEK